MTSFGKYSVSYTPSNDPTEYLQTSVQMSISSEANLSDMAAFFTDFLRATGYVFDGALEIVDSNEEAEDYFDSRDYWKEKFFSLLNSPD